jgi:hypothetical protein
MSFVDIVTVISGLVAIAGTVATGIAALINTFRKRGHSTEKAMKVMTIIFGAITAMSAVTALAVGLSRPTIAVNHYTGVPLPGRAAPTEPNYNTVVVITPTPTPPTVTKTLIENRTLTCIPNDCRSGLTVMLNNIVIDTTHRRTTWYFTITNNSATACSSMNVSLYLEDPSSIQTPADVPGTLTEYNPLNVGQSLPEYTTIALLPQPGVPYTLHATPNCNGSQDTDQVETFTF